MKQLELDAVVTQRIDLAPGLMVLRVTPEKGPVPVFQSGRRRSPGQIHAEKRW